MRHVYCDYCGREAELTDSSAVYGRSYGFIWLCRSCGAYVGCHRGTMKPLGRLANAELRCWKRRTHNIFDQLWKCGRFRGNRNGAYVWLADQMHKPVKKTHIGMFDVADCKMAIRILKGDTYV